VTASQEQRPIRVVVADDQEIVRAGFSALLTTQPDFEVVGVASDGAQAVRICRELHPDVVVMDVRMPIMDGIEATRLLATRDQPVKQPGPPPEQQPEVWPGEPEAPRILMLTTFDLDEYVYDALAAGASGFLLKDVAAEDLFEAVRVIAAGHALLAPAITARLVTEFVRLRPKSVANSALSTLTPREAEVLRLIAEGLSNTEIAARLVVSDETVKTHVSHVLAKLGLRDRVQAVITAYEEGIVVPRAR
jgi:DNA-binding NarL/FixJ family response regulator